MQAGLQRLKPMGLSDLLDTMFRIYRANFLTLIGIVAIIKIPLVLLHIGSTMLLEPETRGALASLQQRLTSGGPSLEVLQDLPLTTLGWYFLVALLLAIIELIVAQQLISGALTYAASRCYLGQPISIPGAYRFGIQRMIALILAGIFVAILITAASLIVITVTVLIFVLFAAISGAAFAGRENSTTLIPLVGALVGSLALLAALGLILLIVVTIATLFLFVPQAIVLEGHSPIAAMSRSLQLVRSSFWRVIGTTLIAYVIIQLIAVLLSWTMGMGIEIVSRTLNQDALVRQLLLTINAHIIAILMFPPLTLVYTLLYYDIRMRKEGLDLQYLTHHAQ